MFRSTVRRATALTAVAVLVLTAAACAKRPDAGPATDPAAQKAVFESTPAAGRIESFTWNLGAGEPASLDWVRNYSESENIVQANLCEGLMRQNSDFSISPGLAESSDQPDPRTAVYRIRKGVTFWDGSPLTADDVVFSLSRHRDPASGSYWATPFSTK
jgi:peptide/nickel transport system substrate-binding protein